MAFPFESDRQGGPGIAKIIVIDEPLSIQFFQVKKDYDFSVAFYNNRIGYKHWSSSVNVSFFRYL